MKGCYRTTLLVSICCWQFTAAVLANGQEELAALWAPALDQFYNTASNYSQANPAHEDTSTVFNFDLDWRANNNWENLNYYKLKPPAVYYSVVEDGKFYYLGYYLYYPRHLGGDPHGNDFAGLALALEKLSNGQGRLAGLLLYDEGGWQEISLSNLPAAGNFLRVAVSAGNHSLALRNSPSTGNVMSSYPPGRGGNGPATSYRLVSLEELWQHRGEIQDGEAYGTLEAKSSGTLKNLPWRWQYKGVNWLADPAAVFRRLSGGKAFTGDYLSNPYAK